MQLFHEKLMFSFWCRQNRSQACRRVGTCLPLHIEQALKTNKHQTGECISSGQKLACCRPLQESKVPVPRAKAKLSV